jgi:hypothetical protein
MTRQAGRHQPAQAGHWHAARQAIGDFTAIDRLRQSAAHPRIVERRARGIEGEIRSDGGRCCKVFRAILLPHPFKQIGGHRADFILIGRIRCEQRLGVNFAA